MSKMVQIRHMPDATHRIVKSRAALAGLSLSDYLLQIIQQIAQRPTIEELLERVRRRDPVTLPISASQLIREGRESH